MAKNKGGRPRGSKVEGIPACPSHPGSSVTLAGRYGKDGSRQRYRCTPLHGTGDPVGVHKFAGDTPRLLAAGHVCERCDSTVPEHQGPPVPRRYRFPVEQAAAALVMVGQGISYTEAANRARVQRGRDQSAAGAQLVGNWVEALAPVVCAARRPDQWPETVVLDSTNFMVTNRAMGTTTQAFAVLGAWGYEKGQKEGLAWAFHATHRAQAAQWEGFLRSKSGEPVLVVCDAGPAITAAVKVVWPNAVIKLCEHHLRQRAVRTLGYYGKHRFGSPEMQLLNDAFHGPAEWQAFKKGVEGPVRIDAWLRLVDADVTAQVRARATLPQHHSTGALDEGLARIREFMEHRAYCYRNAERTNRMLELVRMRLNLADDPSDYALAIRHHLEANGGRLPPQGTVRDIRGVYSLRV